MGAQGPGQRRAKRILKASHDAGSRLGESARAIGELGVTDQSSWQFVQAHIAQLSSADSSLASASSALDAVSDALASVANATAAADDSIQFASKSASSLSSSLGDLHTSAETSSARAHAAEQLLQRCSLSHEEHERLRSDPPDSTEFFHALQRAGEARAECRRLLRIRHRQVLVDLLDELASARESALERLGRWCQSHARELLAPGDATEPDEEGAQRYVYALRALSPRPALFNAAAEAAACARRDASFRRFVLTLTRGEPSNPKARPLETKAETQPARFVADMLGHIHQTAASERDFANLLFESGDHDNEPVVFENGDSNASTEQQRTSREVDDEQQQQQQKQQQQQIAWGAETFVAKATESLVRPFRDRAEQAMQSARNEEAESIQSTLSFYSTALSGLAGSNSSLSAALRALCSSEE